MGQPSPYCPWGRGHSPCTICDVITFYVCRVKKSSKAQRVQMSNPLSLATYTHKKQSKFDFVKIEGNFCLPTNCHFLLSISTFSRSSIYVKTFLFKLMKSSDWTTTRNNGEIREKRGERESKKKKKSQACLSFLCAHARNQNPIDIRRLVAKNRLASLVAI